jgi:DNA-binding NtrC family response regulator
MLPSPIRHWDPASANAWPAGGVGSLIVSDVARLDDAGQRALYEWLNQRAAERIQVLSVTAVPLWPLVARGAFLDALYYRLNVMHLAHPLALG